MQKPSEARNRKRTIMALGKFMSVPSSPSLLSDRHPHHRQVGAAVLQRTFHPTIWKRTQFIVIRGSVLK